jgi:hypothetical protein
MLCRCYAAFFVPRSLPLNTFCLSCRYVDIIHGSGNHAAGADAVLRSSVMATGSLCGRLVAVNFSTGHFYKLFDDR